MYENILNAVKSQKLSSAQEIENYDVFSKLQKEGVVLSDLVRKASEADDLRKKVDDMSRSRPAVDTELLAVMESAVKDVESVKAAKKKVSDERKRVIEEICMHDDRYRQAMEDYRAEVNRAYVDMKESKDVI